MIRKASHWLTHTTWRWTALLNTLLISALTIGIAISFSVSLSKGGHSGLSRMNETVLFEGDCDTSRQINIALHVLINIVSTAILGSTNFLMQVLCAPSRHETDIAHAKGRYLEIGVQSLRNLRSIPRRRASGWVLLAVTSIPIHICFNSAILDTRSSTRALLVLAQEGFIHGEPFTLSGIRSHLRLHYEDSDLTTTTTYIAESSSKWPKIDISECWRRYNDPFAALRDYRHGVMVIGSPIGGVLNSSWMLNSSRSLDAPTSGLSNIDRDSNVLLEAFELQRADIDVLGLYFQRSGDLKWGFYTNDEEYGVRWNEHIRVRDNTTGEAVLLRGRTTSDLEVTAQYCLSEPIELHCQLQVYNWFLWGVLATCICKSLICMCITVGCWSWAASSPMVTLGDGLKSFVCFPDFTTEGCCTLGMDSFQRRHAWQSVPRAWTFKHRRLWQSIPKTIWILSAGLIFSTLVVAASLLGLAASSRMPLSESVFGPDERNGVLDLRLYELPSRIQDILSVLCVNGPQLVLSICYLAFNGLFTRMLSEMEWVRYRDEPASLRVTDPEGEQRSTFRLQLPYRWSIPLMVLAALLHWILSNTLYITSYRGECCPKHVDLRFFPLTVVVPQGLGAVAPYENIETNDQGIRSQLAIGLSTKALLVMLIISTIAALVPIVLGLRRMNGSMPLLRNSSIVISAACHCIANYKSRDKQSHFESEWEESESVQLMPNNEEHRTSTCLSQDDVVAGKQEQFLRALAMGKVQWGVVQPIDGEAGAKHLAFGAADQILGPPVEGEVYL